ncbi:MAG: hypothetical protein AAGA54_10745, partial [Myxococcota bacterium]
MTRRHRVEPGDSVLKLAYAAGLRTWKELWDHRDNAELRARRADPQTLYPGDVLAIPDRDPSPEPRCPVNKVHRFQLTRPRAWLNLAFHDACGDPLADTRFELEVGYDTHAGRTDAEGLLSVEIDPTQERGRVTLWLDDPSEVLELPIDIGHLDPRDETSGAVGRLRNLDLPSDASTDLDDDTTLLLQRIHDLD